MTRDQGRPRGDRAGRWTGGILAVLILALAGPAVARQAAAQPSAVAAQAPVVTNYAECTRAYAARRDVATYCRRRFPAPTVNSYDTCVAANGATAQARAMCAQRYPETAPKPSEPVDVTKLIDAWLDRPKPEKPAPADPLAVIPQIQAACARYAGNAERWLRCTADGWRDSGLRGQPPLVLQTPPTLPPVSPPVSPPVEPPVVLKPETLTPPPAKPRPPVAKPEASAPKPPPEEVAPPRPPVVTPKPPPPKVVDVSPPPQPPPPPPPERGMPAWAWWLIVVVALVTAGAGGFGLSRWMDRLRRTRSPATTPPQAETAPCEPPQIALVADPGVVVLTQDGPPRAGMAVSMSIALGEGASDVRLDDPTLETTP